MYLKYNKKNQQYNWKWKIKYMVKIKNYLCYIEKWNYVRPSLSQPKKYNGLLKQSK